MNEHNARHELIEHLLKGPGDQECDHCMAEKLLLAYLRDSGDGIVADAWEKAQDVQGWWYA